MDIEKRIKREIKKLKYTNYIVNGDYMDIEQLIPKERYYREATVLIMIPVAVAGLAIFTSVLPLTATVDTTTRSLRYLSIKEKKWKKNLMKALSN